MPTFTHLKILTKPALALLGQALLKSPTKQNLTLSQSSLFMQRFHIKKITLILLFSPIVAQSWELNHNTYQFDSIANHVFVMHGPLDEPNKANTGFMNNPGLIIGKEGLVVIDPGSSKQVGEQVIKEIEKISKKPIVAVFNTHIHGDHWLGNHAIINQYPKVKIYAHPMMITKAKEGEGANWLAIMSRLTQGLSDGTVVTYPTNSAQHKQVITIGSQKFRIHSPVKNSHTNTDIIIEHINSKTLFLGDNSFVNRMARFGNSSDMHNNIKVLQYAIKLDLTHYVPGHGMSGSAELAIKPFLNYLKIIQKVSLKGYEEDLVDYEIKPGAIMQLTQYKDWYGFEANLGRNISKMLLEIEARDE